MKSNPLHPPQRISSRSDFIPLGISSVSPILETDLIAAKGRCPLSLTIRLILLRQILGILPHIGGRYSRLPLKGLVKVCGVVKAAGKGDFKQGHRSARGNEANCMLVSKRQFARPLRRLSCGIHRIFCRIITFYLHFILLFLTLKGVK